jgi:predicted site-specific integrase-resolvase
MGVLARPTETGEDFRTLKFPELIGRDRRDWTVLIARISRDDAREALDRQQQANRYLII